MKLGADTYRVTTEGGKVRAISGAGEELTGDALASALFGAVTALTPYRQTSIRLSRHMAEVATMTARFAEEYSRSVREASQFVRDAM